MIRILSIPSFTYSITRIHVDWRCAMTFARTFYSEFEVGSFSGTINRTGENTSSLEMTPMYWHIALTLENAFRLGDTSRFCILISWMMPITFLAVLICFLLKSIVVSLSTSLHFHLIYCAATCSSGMNYSCLRMRESSTPSVFDLPNLRFFGFYHHT